MGLTDKELHKVISRHVPTITALKIVQFFLGNKSDMADIKHIAAAIREKPKTIKKIMGELVGRGVIKSMGGGLYNYAPDVKLKENIGELMSNWNDAAKRRKLLPHFRVDKEEKKGFVNKIMAIFGK